jgi:SNF2 family DNA or RNA helicase
MLPWTPEAIEQWEGRFVRRGMNRPVLIQYLVAEKTVDSHIEDLLLSKLPDVDDVVGNGAVEGLSADLANLGSEEEVLAKLVAMISKADVED